MSTKQYTAYLPHVEAYLAAASGLEPARTTRPLEHGLVAEDAPVCVLFSPHPDDEVIAGGVAWRLRHQCRWRVVNVAVTLGSRLDRREARWQELQACCDFLGFELRTATGQAAKGLEGVQPEAAAQRSALWLRAVDALATQLNELKPQLIVCPHALDGHPTHMATHMLVRQALAQMTLSKVDLLLSEYWNTQLNPRLAVGLSSYAVAALMEGLALHQGEVLRNPYHLLLPAWFMDSARRGAERVAKTGGAAFDFPFASLYGCLRWEHGHWHQPPPCVWSPTDTVWPLTAIEEKPA